MPPSLSTLFNKIRRTASFAWLQFAVKCSGGVALAWFLIRVIPKPSRASYPCQRAAFPAATAFVIWLGGLFALKCGWRLFSRRVTLLCWGFLAAAAAWTMISFATDSMAQNTPVKLTDWNFIPAPSNQPVGVAHGIYPGRVVWARDPLATKWAGNWKQKSDQWWLDENTDQNRVDNLLGATLTSLTGKSDAPDAWKAIFEHYNQTARGLSRGYQPGEVVAVKINLNNSDHAAKVDNEIDATPQTVLAMVRQLVNKAGVRQEDILVYDARRYIPPYILSKVWNEFKDVRFLQQKAADPSQPKHPTYGDYRKLEAADWVEGVEYSNGKYKDAKLIPKQVFDATYLVNLALLKAHSYPYNTMENGDEGQTGVTMTGKNHFGSIKGTPELHPSIDTDREANKPHSYSPIVDLASCPNLGAKTILYVLDGLYCGRKWRSYPQHFPNPPFNNRTEPYENPDWPSSILASFDGVALDSVGLDILFAQTKNNSGADGHPRILIRANADDYLFEEALADHPPSGTAYMQGGKTVASLGVHEHWNNDEGKQYSRNLDPVNGKGIELIYIKPEELPKLSSSIPDKSSPPVSKPAPTPVVAISVPPEIENLNRHDFFYAGESKVEGMSILKGGKVVWSYIHPATGEISDATMQTNGNILFAHQHGITEITPDKKVVWNLDAPEKTEIHTALPFGDNSVAFIQNGNPARFMVINKLTSKIEHQFELPVKNTNNTHGQFREMRFTPNGTILIAHMDLGKAVEYDLNGKELWSVDVPGIWSVRPLENGNILATSRNSVREINRKGETVWEWNASAAPELGISNIQTAERLPNGNTIINNWFNQWQSKFDETKLPVQAIEVTPDKKVVWALRSWKTPVDLGPSTIIQLLPADSSL